MTSASLYEKYSNYHYCIVRDCKNTSIKTPGKLWIRVPHEINMRNTWLKFAKKDPDSLSRETKAYFCEDHFDLENDMENYVQYKIMGSVKRIRMKPSCIPSKFVRKRKHNPTPDEKQHDSKNRAAMPSSEDSMEMSTSCFHQELLTKEDATSCTSNEKELHSHNIEFYDQAVQVQPLQKNEYCQVVQDLQSTITKIKKNPRLYIGIPAELYFIVDIISNHTKLSENNILLCLMKIRLNRTFSQLADDFDISPSQARKIFCNKIPIIGKVLMPLLKPTKATIKNNLPIPFRLKYNVVNYIIDGLEIEIQKPKNVIHQALTWSEYKNANTFKYLISCTPDGLIRFVSKGYGGRVSDIDLVEHCKFLDSLEPRSSILADRGFKHIEMYLQQRGFTLLRPPSVAVGSKLTKSETKQTTEIASLRIHVKRVIRRIREFSILKPRSVVNSNLLHVLDFCVITACALINLQDSYQIKY
ncbi:uncharacterized protein [Choristoneura fumiferana]|uniref:uncharacterized protein n=1 Tax=Choristoneura fumiferana TaxID=7141 RepID=UPI003D15ECC2